MPDQDPMLLLSWCAILAGGALAFVIGRVTGLRLVAAAIGTIAGFTLWFFAPILLGQNESTNDPWFKVAVIIWASFALGAAAVGAVLGPFLKRKNRPR